MIHTYAAYGFAPASTIAPLGTTTLVSNAILAPVLLDERFRKQDFLGIIFAILGAASVVSSSKSHEFKVQCDPYFPMSVWFPNLYMLAVT